MRGLAALKSFIRAWLMRSRMEHDMDREMRFHIDARADDLEARGLPREEAERLARSEFGGMLRWKEAGREVRGLGLADDLVADLRYAVRTMRSAPGLTTTAVLSLALGIGGVTAIFGLLDLLLLRPVPVRHPGELVHVTTAGQNGDASSGSSNTPWFRAVASRADLFSDAMLVHHDLYKVGIGGRVQAVTGQRVTTNYHDLLGVPALVGRTFHAGDDPDRGAAPVVVISYGLWQRRFGGRADAVGASITVDQQPYTVVGVTPPTFGGLMVGWTMDVTMPLALSGSMDPAGWRTMPLIARVKPGVEIARIAPQLDPILQRFVAQGISERFRRRYLERVAVEPAAAGISDLRAQFSRPLTLLMAAVGLILLIACVNLAGLLVARNATRQHELSTRMALGAGRSRIVRQLLTESVMLAAIGGTLGVLLAVRGGNLLIGFLPPHFGPVSLALGADWRMLAFTLTATIATTLLFGLLPAWQAARLDTRPAAHRVSPRSITTRAGLGRTLVVAQCALSIVLVTGAVLVVRTLVNLTRVDTGFDRDHVLLVQMDPQGTGYDGDRLRMFQQDMLTALRSLPGVRVATVATSSPFNGNVDSRRLSVPGVEPREPDDAIIQTNMIGADYFEAFRVPILVGRPIDVRDQPNTAKVAVVSESFARRYFGEVGAAVGERFTTGSGERAITQEIVGVAADVRYQDLRARSERLIYLPWFQASVVRSMPFEFVIGTEGDPANWVGLVRREIERLRPDAPILAIDTMTGVMNRQLVSERLLAALGSVFALVALVLAAVGVYGLFAHAVARRIPEIGVRLALGARPGAMMWTTLRDNLALATLGCVIGLGAAALGLRVLDGVLFGLSSVDATTFLAAAITLVLVSFAAAYLPARRAASVDPLVALRCE